MNDSERYQSLVLFLGALRELRPQQEEPQFRLDDQAFAEVVFRLNDHGNPFARCFRTLNCKEGKHCADFVQGMKQLRSDGVIYMPSDLPLIRFVPQRSLKVEQMLKTHPLAGAARDVARAYLEAIEPSPN